MSTQLEPRLRAAVRRMHITWTITMVIAAGLTFTFMPAWCLLLLIPFAVVSYVAMAYAMIGILAIMVSPEEIAEQEAANKQDDLNKAKFEAVANIAQRQAAGEKVPDDEILEALSSVGIVDIVKVDDVGPVIGTYKDVDIYEYVNVQTPPSNEVSKLMYFGPANIVDGIPEVPVIDGMIFAVVGNILYSKEKDNQQK